MAAINENDNGDRNKLNPTKSKTDNIINCIAPVLVLEHVLGIFRFRITDNNLAPTTCVMKILGLVITIVVGVVFAAVFKENVDVFDVIEDMPSIALLIQYISSAIMTSCLLNKANILIMTLLADLDCILHLNTCDGFYKKSKTLTIIALAVISSIRLISSISDYILAGDKNNFVSVISDMLYYLLNFVQDIETLLFFLMINMLKSRLQVINHYLVHFIHNDCQDKTSVYTIRQRSAKTETKFNLFGIIRVTNLHELASSYDIIGEICSLINMVYNYQIFMTLISVFIYIVIALWTAVYYFRTEEYDSDNLFTIILWFFSQILTVASMSFVCGALLSTRDDTKVLVNKLVMDYGLPASARAQAKAFMELIDAWPLRIFVYDLFSVDITLILKFISVSTTYLIVIVQISLAK
ncbi:uncharacterized protein [Choristoneura fumiferana]|uniref:uncharacterized protein n=1 Tax=Choristoneura fumiferana TaxID=7141 RepID=UPI003D15EF00